MTLASTKKSTNKTSASKGDDHMTLSNLPDNVTEADIDREFGGSDCYKCDHCTHDSVEFNDVTDQDMGVVRCSGTCEGCAADMDGRGRYRDPEGSVEDIEWSVSSNGCNHETPSREELRADAEEARAEAERDEPRTHNDDCQVPQEVAV